MPGQDGCLPISKHSTNWEGQRYLKSRICLEDSWDYFGRFEKKDRKKHEEFFAHSSFPVIKKIEFDVHEEHTIEELIGLLLSYSYIHPVLLNERNAEFRDRMTRRLLEIQPGGVFVRRIDCTTAYCHKAKDVKFLHQVP